MQLFFDAQDKELLELVDSIVDSRVQSVSQYALDSSMHPHGIIEINTKYSFRIAYAVITVLNAMQKCGIPERLQALRKLHDEVLHCSHSPLRYNTGRVLIQLMKDIVRSRIFTERLSLAHDFHQAVHGSPRIVRRLLHRYHLLEMPETWNQQSFDHHVHDANTKGCKTPTHLVMDAWLKGIRYLTVMYYNCVDPEAAEELLQAAQIMEMQVRIGIEFRTCFRGRFVDITWVPLQHESPEQFEDLLGDSAVMRVLDDYRPASTWMREHTVALLTAWNTCHAAQCAAHLGIEMPGPLQKHEFLRSVGHRQAQTLHLAEYIYRQILPQIQKKMDILQVCIAQAQDSTQRDGYMLQLKILENIVPDTIASQRLSPAANPRIVFPHVLHASMPSILLQAPEVLVERLAALGPAQIILGLVSLRAADVLELLWITKGRITHLELFNVHEWSAGKLTHIDEINQLQCAINEGTAPSIKHCIQHIIAVDPLCDKSHCSAHECRKKLFQEILTHIPRLQQFYGLLPLGARIGTNSTSRSHHTHGMGLVFPETLPTHVQHALRKNEDSTRLRLPIYTDVYKFTHYHEQQHARLGLWCVNFLRATCGLLSTVGYRVVYGWRLEKSTTRVQQQGNICTLGGVNAQGVSKSFSVPLAAQPSSHFGSKISYLNTKYVNIGKVLCGFIPAQLTFMYVDSWWVLTFYGALLWFFITGFRNIIQSILGGGGLNKSVLLSWKYYINWNRIADSLLYTGLSVPLLEVIVRVWLLEDMLGLTVREHALAVYTIIAVVNSFYISGHNLFRGLPKEAVLGNVFRSALAIPLSMVYGALLAHVFSLVGMADPLTFTQNCAAITAKCASDTVAAVIEGFADRNVCIHLREWDYSTKFIQIFRNFSRQELLLPHVVLEDFFSKPKELYEILHKKNPVTARKAIINMLDMMYLWYYHSRAQQVFIKKFKALSQEEQQIILGMHNLLRLEKEISELFLSGLLGKNFASALSFYLKNTDNYLSKLKKI